MFDWVLGCWQADAAKGHFHKGTEVMWCKAASVMPNLCDPMDYSQPGFPVQGILQESRLKSGAMPSSRGSSRPRDQTGVSYLLHCQVGSLPLVPAGKLRIWVGLNEEVTPQYDRLFNEEDSELWLNGKRAIFVLCFHLSSCYINTIPSAAGKSSLAS